MRYLKRVLALLALTTMPSGLLLAAPILLKLPAATLQDGLHELSRQSGVPMEFPLEAVQGIRAPALQGNYEMDEVLRLLLADTDLTWRWDGNSIVLQRKTANAIDLPVQSIIGDGNRIDSGSSGRSTLTYEQIERQQADNIPALLQTLPGVSMGGSSKPSGQTVNIWGLGDAEDVPFSLDGAVKSGFERYQQGTVFIEPELIARIEVEKGPYSVFSGNGGFGGTVNMQTKGAGDLLSEGRHIGSMLKFGYHSNDQQKIYSGAVYGRLPDDLADGLLYVTTRDGRDMKLAGHVQLEPEYRYPKRYPFTDQKLDGLLAKGNFRPNVEQNFSLSYARSESETFSPFSAVSFVLPSWSTIQSRGGLENALRRLMADRKITDTTLSASWHYQPLDNPWLDVELKASRAKTEQTDERREGALYQITSGGKKMTTRYLDKVLELRNISRFNTEQLGHELTVGLAWHEHRRDVLMYIPNSTYQNANYNFGYFAPAFMPPGKQNTQSFYVQDALSWGDLTLTPSLRFDAVKNQGKRSLAPIYNNPLRGHDYRAQRYSGFSPRLSLFWKGSENFALFADYARTWRAPVIDEQYEVQNSANIGGSSRHLDAERIRGVRGGAVLNVQSLFSEEDWLQLRTTAFRHRIRDEIFRTRGVICPEQSRNGGALTDCNAYLPAANYRNLPPLLIKGLEVESYYDSHYLFGSLSYTWLWGKRQGAYSNPWGPNVWARDIAPPTWKAALGFKLPSWDLMLGWQGEFVRKTDRLPGDNYSGGLGTSLGDLSWNHYGNASYDNHRLFGKWQLGKLGLNDTQVNLSIDNLFNRFYRPALSGDGAYSQGRNAKISLTQFF